MKKNLLTTSVFSKQTLNRLGSLNLRASLAVRLLFIFTLLFNTTASILHLHLDDFHTDDFHRDDLHTEDLHLNEDSLRISHPDHSSECILCELGLNFSSDSALPSPPTEVLKTSFFIAPKIANAVYTFSLYIPFSPRAPPVS